MSNPRKFFDEWSVYDEVLDHNYMFHDEIFEEVGRFLARRYESRPFSVLDLGCGSARHLSGALAGRAVGRYVGYDLSAAALSHACRNLSRLNCPVELYSKDLLDGVREGEAAVDLIVCSFAFHHLASADKALFFRSAHSRLNNNGCFLLIDVAREESEERPVYLDRYCGWLRSEWNALSAEGLDALCEHVRGNDFPETAAALYGMAAEAGFGGGRELNRFRWHHTWYFEKNRVVRSAEKPD